MLTFTVLDHTNTAHITLSDPRPNNWHARTVDTLAEPRAIANTILHYARERRIDVADVETSIQYPMVQS